MIYALPGMGAESGMYGPEWRALPDIRFLEWPAYRGEVTVTEVARRVIAEAGIRDDDTIIGISLGGIVGGEIAQHCRLRQLVLVSSATDGGEISKLLEFLHPLADLASVEFVQRMVGKFHGPTAGMFSRADPAFIRAMCRAVFTWSGLPPAAPRPLRLHGRHDLVIPCPPDADLILEGGHLVALDHAAECVAFVSAHLTPPKP